MLDCSAEFNGRSISKNLLSGPDLTNQLVDVLIRFDKLEFQVHMKEKPLTREGILSSLSAIYDQLGLVAPLMLEGRRIVQSFCHQNLDWEEQIPDRMARQWAAWKSNYYSWKY